jgi:hypothetical protein
MPRRGVLPARRIDQHVGCRQQPVDVDLVGGDASLSIVEIGEPAARTVNGRGEGSVGVACGRLDLDDLGAEVGEQARRVGGRRQRTDLDDCVRRCICMCREGAATW